MQRRKFGMDRENSTVEAEEIRAFHKELWDKYLEGRGTRDNQNFVEFRDAVAQLLEQGYRLSEVALMFGYTRERMRQLVVNLWQLRESFPPGSRRPQLRLFNWETSRFEAKTYKEAFHLELDISIAAKISTLREELKALIVELTEELGRPPTLTELGVARGYTQRVGYNAIPYRLGAHQGLEKQTPCRNRGLEILDTLYAELGLKRTSGRSVAKLSSPRHAKWGRLDR